MRLLTIWLILMLIIIPTAASAQNVRDFVAGHWYGLLEFQGSELILAFDFEKNAGDSLSGTMLSPLQSADKIPVTRIDVIEDSVKIYIKSLGVKYTGRIYLADSLLKGTFNQAIFSIPLELKKTKEPFSLKRPQEPKPPFNYATEDIVFKNEKSGIKLAGTLSFPDSYGKFPCVVLISGSGPQNRDEEIFGHKPFGVIADFFSRNGLAVLRYDDRGTGKSEGNFTQATTMDFAHDAIAGVNFLKTHARIDTNKIGLLGHSEGGMIAPIVAAGNNISFVILLAGPAISGEDVLLTQILKMLEIEGAQPQEIKRVMTETRKTYRIIKKNPQEKKAAIALRKYFEKAARNAPKEKHFEYGYTKSAIEMKIQAMNAAWFRYFLAFQPEDYLRCVKCPILAIYGGKDIQVLAEPNKIEFEKIMKKYNKSNYAAMYFEGKNHLFQNALKGTITEYIMLEETISPDVLEAMLKWINEVNK